LIIVTIKLSLARKGAMSHAQFQTMHSAVSPLIFQLASLSGELSQPAIIEEARTTLRRGHKQSKLVENEQSTWSCL